MREASRHLDPADVLVVQQSDPSLVRRVVDEVRSLDRTGQVPVLAVVGHRAALDLDRDDGIDDFVVLPIDRNELAARLGMLLARPPGEGESMSVGGLVVDMASHEVLIDDARVMLTRKEFDLLRFLMRHRGRVFSRPVLFEEVWGGMFVRGSRTVDVHIRRLRSKLGPIYGPLIQTVRQAGYLFSGRSSE